METWNINQDIIRNIPTNFQLVRYFSKTRVRATLCLTGMTELCSKREMKQILVKILQNYDIPPLPYIPRRCRYRAGFGR